MIQPIFCKSEGYFLRSKTLPNPIKFAKISRRRINAVKPYLALSMKEPRKIILKLKRENLEKKC